MVFSIRITTDANTSELLPLRTLLKCAQGVIYQVDVMFPPGSSGLMGVQIRNQNISLYPRNRGEWFIGDNYSLSFPDLFELYIDSNIIEILTYNLDTDYSHLCAVSIGIVAKGDFIEHFLPGRSVKGLIESMEHLTAIMAPSEIPVDRSLIDRILGR